MRDKIPSALVLLGEPIEVMIGDDPDTAETWTFDRGAFYLASSGSGRELWIIPKPARKRTTTTIPDKAARLFKRWAGWHPDKAFRMEVSTFNAKRFGDCLAVAYRSNKWSGRQVGYIHTFDHCPKVEVDNKTKPSIWRIFGARLKVEARGITG